MSDVNAKCPRCSSFIGHFHRHDEAHVISGTHMAGTERFVCSVCSHTTFANSEPKNPAFKFILDGCDGP